MLKQLQPPMYVINFLWIMTWVAVAFILYGFQLSGSWRFDDGHHLLFLSKNFNLNYFYSPDAAILQSGAHYTPFNIFTYDLAHRFFTFQHPEGFYVFHLVLLGIATGALFLCLSLVTSFWPALLGTTFFILGFPIAGISGQLMVGHYVTGYIFAGLCLYFYERALRNRSFSSASVIFYFLACLCKEIFVPLIAIFLIDPRQPIRERIRHIAIYGAALVLFWIIRTIMVQQVVGGYNDVLQTPLNQVLKNILSGFISYFFGTRSGSALGTLCVLALAVSLYAAFKRFGLWATLFISAGVLGIIVVPLLPVSFQIGPKTPVEIRLITMFWWLMAFATTLATAYILKRFGMKTFFVCGGFFLAVLSWNTTQYIKHGELASTAKQFDAFSNYVIHKTPCHLIDNMGWSSAVNDLYAAIWPGQRHPIVGPLEIIQLEGKPGEKICRYENNSIVMVGEINGQKTCDMTAPLGVTLTYNGSHLTFSFTSNDPGTYYFEVPNKYFLALPSKLTGTYPDKTRFANFRVLKIMKTGEVTCSSLLHFIPSVSPILHWQR